MAEKKQTPTPTKKTGDAKKTALETALSQIEKQFGKGAIMKLGQNVTMQVDAISTGSLSLDLALGIGGLRFYRHIVPAYFPALRPGGWLIFEIGCSQADAVTALCRDAGYISVSVRKDLGGNPRCVLARRPFANAE